ncbi:DNA alkylation repair protein [Fusobacterium russii]|uniref:DNA alkylation repair protein n=1 Tax=Fusobacterium russii TaxID=854 RepID=UPI0003A02072|nr:DNA alkylation repair protein [Fusobacterium russii]
MQENFLKNIKNEEEYSKFIKFLFQEQDLKYKEFNAKIIVVDINSLIGVRIPILRKIAKEIVKGEHLNYLKTFEKLLEKNNILYFEEKLIYSMVCCEIKEDLKDKLNKVNNVIALIDNWALCDCALSSAKFVKKNKDDFFDFLLAKINSKNPWELRFILVSLLEYYVEDKYLEDIFKICEHIKNDHYYVKMAKAWLLSICYVNFKELSFTFLRESTLDNWTINKAVQKIRESLRVNKEDKEKVLALKRK